ncbi:MAG: hypothetical protein ACKN9W_14380, partial [Methylococcus sp.]
SSVTSASTSGQPRSRAACSRTNASALGDLLSEYRVTARGCGKMRAYDVVCDGKLCSLKE